MLSIDVLLDYINKTGSLLVDLVHTQQHIFPQKSEIFVKILLLKAVEK